MGMGVVFHTEGGLGFPLPHTAGPPESPKVIGDRTPNISSLHRIFSMSQNRYPFSRIY